MCSSVCSSRWNLARKGTPFGRTYMPNLAQIGMGAGTGAPKVEKCGKNCSFRWYAGTSLLFACLFLPFSSPFSFPSPFPCPYFPSSFPSFCPLPCSFLSFAALAFPFSHIFHFLSFPMTPFPLFFLPFSIPPFPFQQSRLRVYTCCQFCND